MGMHYSCGECWETPCVCGLEYTDYSTERKIDLVKAVVKGMEEKDFFRLISAIILDRRK